MSDFILANISLSSTAIVYKGVLKSIMLRTECRISPQSDRQALSHEHAPFKVSFMSEQPHKRWAHDSSPDPLLPRGRSGFVVFVQNWVQRTFLMMACEINTRSVSVQVKETWSRLEMVDHLGWPCSKEQATKCQQLVEQQWISVCLVFVIYH